MTPQIFIRGISFWLISNNKYLTGNISKSHPIFVYVYFIFPRFFNFFLEIETIWDIEHDPKF